MQALVQVISQLFHASDVAVCVIICICCVVVEMDL